MKRLAICTLVVATAAAWLTAAPRHVVAATAGGCTVWTDPANDEVGGPAGTIAGAQNDLTYATMATSGGDTLVVRIHVQDMSLAVPAPWTMMGWGVYVTPGGLIEADVDRFGHVSYFDTYASGTGGHPNWSDSGTVVPGPDGYVEIDMPLSHIAGLQPGTTLKYIGGHAVVGVPEYEVEVDNVAVRGSYRVGDNC